jgi:hypothetical protein
MHERTQRAIARLLFVFCCALPTCLSATVVAVTCTPWYADYCRRAIEHELSRQAGVTVLIEAVEYPTPSTTRLLGVRLLEPETRAEIGRVRVVTWGGGDAKNGIYLSQPEMQSEQLPYVWRVIHDRFLCQPELTAVPVRMVAADLTIHSRSGSMTFRDINTWLRPLDRRIEAMIQCVPAARHDDAPVHISVVRDRTSRVASTDWTLNTGDIALPCSALADYLPTMRNLGADATFTGTLKWKINSAGWSIDLGGSRFDEVELSELLHSVPHRLTGRASVRLERCQIDPGSAVDVSGTLLAGSGFIGHSLMRSAQSQLGFDIALAGDAGERDWPYDRIALRFDLFGPQLTLAGICHQQRGFEYLLPGTVVAGAGRRLVGSGGQPQSWASLVRAFWQEGREAVPAASQAAWLLEALPAPHGIPPALSVPPRITAAGELRGHVTIDQP